MILPYQVDVPMVRWPWANWVLIGSTCVVSLGVLLFDLRSGSELEPTATERDHISHIINSAFNPPPPLLALDFQKPSFTQLLTHVLVHGDIWHLLANMLFLFVFGNAVNAKLGHFLYVLLYAALGAFAGGAVLCAGQGRYAVGASGAIMGIVGIFLILYPRNDVKVFWLVGGAVATISSCWLILLFICLDLLDVLLYGSGAGGCIAHLTGVFVGIILGIILVLTPWFGPALGEQNLLQILGYDARRQGRKAEEPEFDMYGKPIRRAQKRVAKRRSLRGL